MRAYHHLRPIRSRVVSIFQAARATAVVALTMPHLLLLDAGTSGSGDSIVSLVIQPS